MDAMAFVKTLGNSEETALNTAGSILFSKHYTYIENLGKDQNDFEYCTTEFLRMSGIYWGVTAMDIMNELPRLDRQTIIDFIQNCQCAETGGISPCQGHDPHLLYTLTAVQILCTYDALEAIDCEAVVRYVLGLQQEDGSFCGDAWGEIDVRFSMCALAVLTLLGRNLEQSIDVPKTVGFIMSCHNEIDGGFGSKPGAESHAGLIYCCVGSLSLLQHLHVLDVNKLGWWLCERQLPLGGLNGRPEKLPDVCYSWWVLASLAIIGRLHWINADKLKEFILSCQDEETGGFSDRAGNMPDIFHSHFGIAALSLLGCEGLKPVNPTLCMPTYVLERLRIKPQMWNDGFEMSE